MSQDPATPGQLAILASMASGDLSVVRIRSKLQGLLREAGSFEVEPASFCIPCIRHTASGFNRYRPDAVYVGYQFCSADVSPWGMPFPDLGLAENISAMYARADLSSLLWPLRNKVLVCNCVSNDWCWPYILQELFMHVFNAWDMEVYDGAFDVRSTEDDSGMHDDNDVSDTDNVENARG